MKRRLLIIFSIITISLNSFIYAEKGYEIKVKINHLSDTSIYLGYHFGKKLYVSDTAKLDKNGRGMFTGKEKLQGGLYIIFLPAKTYFDFIIDENQFFSIENDTTDFVNNIKVTNSPENVNFYKYQQFLMGKQDAVKTLNNIKKEYEKKNDSTSIKKVNDDIEKINQEVLKEMDNVIADNKDNFLSRLILASKDFQLPETPKDAQGKPIDPFFGYNYFVRHFFDNMDFSDPRLLRTPFFESNLERYFTALPMIPDTLIPIADTLIEKAKKGKDKDIFQFVLSFTFNYFLKSNIMGMDAVYAHVGEKYYLSGDASWADSAFIANLKDRVRKIKPNIIGNIAPNLLLESNDGKWYNLQQVIAKYTILVFWDPDCGHCQKAIPKLLETYRKYENQNIKVYAVYTQGDGPKWAEYIQKNNLTWINVWDPYNTSKFRDNYDIYSTPVIYVLDENKTIIAKRIEAEDVDGMLDNLLKKDVPKQ